MKAVMDQMVLKIAECPRCGAEDCSVNATIISCQNCLMLFSPDLAKHVKREVEGTCLACPNVRLEWYEGEYGLREAVCGVTGAIRYRPGTRRISKACKFSSL